MLQMPPILQRLLSLPSCDSVDNSEYMRNGDFLPTRLQAQQDAVNIVCHSKTRSNPENNVGLITLAKYVGQRWGAPQAAGGFPRNPLRTCQLCEAACARHLPRLTSSLFSVNTNNLFLILT